VPEKLRKTDIRDLLRRGRRAYGCWAVLYARRRSPSGACQPEPRPRLAVFTSGKYPNAVKRNRARRLVREACRPLIARLHAPWDLLFRVRPDVLDSAFPERRRLLVRMLQEAGVPIEEPGAAPPREEGP